LGSSPVQIDLSQVFIILSAKHPNQWVFQDYAGFKKKMGILEAYKEQCIRKIVEKSTKKEDGDAGYRQMLVLKIIDNIQIKVSDIHIRFEDQINNAYSWGIVMNGFEAYTCDENWKTQNIDRIKEENVY
jgi:vacuolar protein sorting-associated protein 13A/C